MTRKELGWPLVLVSAKNIQTWMHWSSLEHSTFSDRNGRRPKSGRDPILGRLLSEVGENIFASSQEQSESFRNCTRPAMTILVCWSFVC